MKSSIPETERERIQAHPPRPPAGLRDLLPLLARPYGELLLWIVGLGPALSVDFDGAGFEEALGLGARRGHTARDHKLWHVRSQGSVVRRIRPLLNIGRLGPLTHFAVEILLGLPGV